MRRRAFLEEREWDIFGNKNKRRTGNWTAKIVGWNREKARAQRFPLMTIIAAILYSMFFISEQLENERNGSYMLPFLGEIRDQSCNKSSSIKSGTKIYTSCSLKKGEHISERWPRHSIQPNHSLNALKLLDWTGLWDDGDKTSQS